MELINRICDDLAAIRTMRPLVHSITNFVVMNETANATLCIGALPIMAHALEEVEEMASVAGAVVLNIGTLTPDWVEAMVLAGRRANQAGAPVILDPVGAGATRLRTESSRRILDHVEIAIVRGNAAEVAALSGVSAEIRGVESISAGDTAEQVAAEFTARYGTAVAITGVVDLVSDGTRAVRISNGHEMLGKLVGTGCMSNVIVGAFAAVQPDAFEAAVGGLTAFGIAGEMAATVSGDRPGTFHSELYNALYALDSATIAGRARLTVL